MSVINDETSPEEVAALVCSTLDKYGIAVALSGGAVVSIYTENAYESYDLDFITLGIARKVDDAMDECGFHKEGRYWVHPNSRYWVEFPPGPVQVGDTTVTEFATKSTKFGKLRLLAPTECVMDRLAGYYHWQDPQGLQQAVLVAAAHEVDLRRIEEWSRRERAETQFQMFLNELQRN